MRGPEPRADVQNIVFVFDVGMKFDIDKIARTQRGAEYNPESFPGVTPQAGRPEGDGAHLRLREGHLHGHKERGGREKGGQEVQSPSGALRAFRHINRMYALYAGNMGTSIRVRPETKARLCSSMIRPERGVSDRELLKKSLGALVREFGLDPDRIIMWDAVSAEPHRTFVSSDELENHHIRVLRSTLREQLKREVIEGIGSTKMPHRYGGPGGIRTLDRSVSSQIGC